MTRPECLREAGVVAAVLSDRWPAGCEEELRAHVQGCATCRDIADVAALFREDCRSVGTEVRVPAAGQVWWRAAIRARAEAVHQASRPVTWLQALAGACAVGAAAAIVTAAWPSVRGLAGRAAVVATDLDSRSADLVAPMVSQVAGSLPFFLAIAALVVLTPILVLYVALSGD